MAPCIWLQHLVLVLQLYSVYNSCMAHDPYHHWTTGPMITHTLLLASNLPLKTLVARQQPIKLKWLCDSVVIIMISNNNNYRERLYYYFHNALLTIKAVLLMNTRTINARRWNLVCTSKKRGEVCHAYTDMLCA